MSVTTIKKANGEEMKVIDGAYVIGAGGACQDEFNPCEFKNRKVLDGAYVLDECGGGNNTGLCDRIWRDLINGDAYVARLQGSWYIYKAQYLEIENFEELYVGGLFAYNAWGDIYIFYSRLSKEGSVFVSKWAYNTTFSLSYDYETSKQLPEWKNSNCYVDGAGWVYAFIKDISTGKAFLYYRDSYQSSIQNVDLSRNDGYIPFNLEFD